MDIKSTLNGMDMSVLHIRFIYWSLNYVEKSGVYLNTDLTLS